MSISSFYYEIVLALISPQPCSFPRFLPDCQKPSLPRIPSPTTLSPSAPSPVATILAIVTPSPSLFLPFFPSSSYCHLPNADRCSCPLSWSATGCTTAFHCCRTSLSLPLLSPSNPIRPKEQLVDAKSSHLSLPHGAGLHPSKAQPPLANHYLHRLDVARPRSSPPIPVWPSWEPS